MGTSSNEHPLSLCELSAPARFPPTFNQITKLWNGYKDPMGGPAVGLAVKQFWVTKEKREELVLHRVLRDTEQDIRKPNEIKMGVEN